MSVELAREEAGAFEADSPILISLLDRAGRGADRMRGMIDALHAYAVAGDRPRAASRSTSPRSSSELDPAIAGGDLPTVTADPDQLRVAARQPVRQRPPVRAARACRPTVSVDGRASRRHVAGRGRRRRPRRVPSRGSRAGLRADGPARQDRARAPASAWRPADGSSRRTAAGSASTTAPDGGTRRLVRAAGGALVPVRLARQVEHPLQRDQRLAARSRGSTWIWLTTVPATSDSIAHTKCGRSIRFIVEQ